MRALVWTAPFEAEVREEPMPHATDGHVVLKVRAAGVCGSDLHGYRGHSPLRVPPLILGHEVVGEDDDGRLYAINPLVGCGACKLCRAGEPNLCPSRGLLGLDRPGAFADYVRVPASALLPLPEGMDVTLGTLVEPLATPLSAMRAASLDDESVVAVIGCGPIGLMAAHAARRASARFVAAYDVDPRRVEQARRVVEATCAGPDEAREVILAASDGLGADLVVDAAGFAATWGEAIALVRPGGVVAAIGLGEATGPVPTGEIVRKGVTVHGTYAYTPADFRAALDMLAAAPPPVSWAQTVALDDGPRVLDELARGEGPIKAVFRL